MVREICENFVTGRWKDDDQGWYISESRQEAGLEAIVHVSSCKSHNKLGCAQNLLLKRSLLLRNCRCH